MGCPLHMTEEILALPYRCLSILREIVQQGADLLNRLMFGRPSGPGRALLILLHQNTEKCVIVQPGGFLFAKFSKLQPSLFASALREIRERFFKQLSLQFFDLPIFNPATSNTACVA